MTTPPGRTLDFALDAKTPEHVARGAARGFRGFGFGARAHLLDHVVGQLFERVDALGAQRAHELAGEPHLARGLGQLLLDARADQDLARRDQHRFRREQRGDLILRLHRAGERARRQRHVLQRRRAGRSAPPRHALPDVADLIAGAQRQQGRKRQAQPGSSDDATCLAPHAF